MTGADRRRVAACLALVAGCEVSSAEHEQAIVGGTINTGDPAVVAIVSRRVRCDQSSTPIVCTGTLIAPTVVLTAAHCLEPGADHGTLEVYVGATVGDPAGRFILVNDAVRHPSFDDATNAYDLGLVRLAEPASVTPVALPTVTLDGSHVGAPARVVGYGVTALGMIADGNRREGTMTVGAVSGLTFETTPAPANSCGGDSGGPVFVTVGGGEQLLGVTVSGDSTCTVRAVNGRVDQSIADFIQPYLAAAAPAPEANIALDKVCSAPCESAADCPAAMTCLPDGDGIGRCQVGGNAAGNLTTACSAGPDCASGLCARVSPDDCRCHVACEAGPDRREEGGSCTTTRDAAWPVLLILLFRRRRSTRRTPA